MDLLLCADGEELRRKFFALRTPSDVADLLEIDYRRLVYHLYINPESERYTIFEIPKKAGGVREVSAPISALKIIQQKLNQVLQHVYEPKASVHGFIYGRGIVSNAQMHRRKRHVLNIDLKDFFPSLNFGRVRGMFMAVPYQLDAPVATVVAQICCFDNQLPQGAPTSPIVSNMICAKSDSQLLRLAERHRCIYTRYADDITFSTSMPTFPAALARTSWSGQVAVGAELAQIIEDNGFQINPRKVRLQTRNGRQEVTGLTVNEFPNVKRKFIRQIRAMLHAWRKFGLQAAEEEFHRCHDSKHRNPDKELPSFARVVKGKIEFLGMVRGKDDTYYRCFNEQLRALAPDLAVGEPEDRIMRERASASPLIVTEGKTDWKHLKTALARLQEQGDIAELEVEFHEHQNEYSWGSANLLKHCKEQSKVPRESKIICVFDRDEPKILRKVTDEGAPYRYWGNETYSLAIPVPGHRQENPDVSIELYYADDEVMRADEHGRRLFLSNEFDTTSGRHKTEDLNCTDLNKIKRPDTVTVIDDRVFNAEGQNVALSKDNFAGYVLSRTDGFDDFSFSEFTRIFDVVSLIAAAR